MSDGISGLRRLVEQSEMPQLVGQTLVQLADEWDEEVVEFLGEEGVERRLTAGLARARGAGDRS
jgi:hypothetical protein